MENWAKLVAEDGKTIYVNSTTGKYLAEVEHLSMGNWAEYTSLTKKEYTGSNRKLVQTNAW